MVRTRWESSAECPGLEMAFVDEVKLPANQAAIVLKAAEVKHGAVGMAFAKFNHTFLETKLQVHGGKYLALIVPGRFDSQFANHVEKCKTGHCA